MCVAYSKYVLNKNRSSKYLHLKDLAQSFHNFTYTSNLNKYTMKYKMFLFTSLDELIILLIFSRVTFFLCQYISVFEY